MAPPILKMEMKMGGLWGKKKNQWVRRMDKEKSPQKKNAPCDGKSDQQRYQLYKTQTNGFRPIRFVQTTTVGQCDLNVHDQTNEAKETASDGNTNVVTHKLLELES